MFVENCCKKCLNNDVITERKNEHGQSELALNELNFKTLKERRTQFSCLSLN